MLSVVRNIHVFLFSLMFSVLTLAQTDVYDQKKIFNETYKLAEQGNTNAQFNMGVYYSTGQGTEPDAVKGWRWFQRAANNGNEMGLAALTQIRTTMGPMISYYLQEASENDIYAHLNLADIYAKGLTTEINYHQAIVQYTVAANSGNALAQYELGRIYEQGLGTAKNLEKALEWYSLADKTGYSNAWAAMVRVKKKMSAQQIASAEEKTRFFLKFAGEQYLNLVKAQYDFAELVQKGQGIVKTNLKEMKAEKEAAEIAVKIKSHLQQSPLYIKLNQTQENRNADTLTVYFSLGCPHCMAFWLQHFDSLNELVRQGKLNIALLEIPMLIPRNFLENKPAEKSIKEAQIHSGLASEYLQCVARIKGNDAFRDAFGMFLTDVQKSFVKPDWWAFSPSDKLIDRNTKVDALLKRLLTESGLNEKQCDSNLFQAYKRESSQAVKDLALRGVPGFFFKEKFYASEESERLIRAVLQQRSN